MIDYFNNDKSSFEKSCCLCLGCAGQAAHSKASPSTNQSSSPNYSPHLMTSVPSVRGILSPTAHSLVAPRLLNPLANKIKKSYIGYVVSDKTQKTINVEITQYYLHPVIKKYVRTSKRFMSHDELEEAEQGDLVEIIQSRPISKRKHWTLNKILKPRNQILVNTNDIHKTSLEQLRQQLDQAKQQQYQAHQNNHGDNSTSPQQQQ
jgi:small subunit ribosomal protein S17